MPTFPERDLLTPFGIAVCWERVDTDDTCYWLCWLKETGICFWFPNTEVRSRIDWSDSRYTTLPFNLDSKRIAALDPLGRHHSYWRDNIKVVGLAAHVCQACLGLGKVLPKEVGRLGYPPYHKIPDCQPCGGSGAITGLWAAPA